MTRKYIRHPADIPIETRVEGVLANVAPALKDIGDGGLCICAQQPLEEDTVLSITIPAVRPPFHARCRVSWCRSDVQGYLLGLEFLDADNAYRARMVEQICHIEHYKNEVRETEGRQLSGHEAASEWIAKFAKDFP